MNGFDYFKKAFLENYANFNGRARRSEYWYYILFQILLMFPLMFLAGAFTGSSGEPSIIVMIIFSLTMLVFIIPSIAVTVRRLHDTGKSGWMYLISLIPLIGGILILVWTVSDSTPGSNQYGPNPKEMVEEDIQDNLV